MTLSEELIYRGFLNQYTFDQISELDKLKPTFYMGFDASADSQTVGNLAGMMFAKVFLRHGLKGILLAGGATSLIGDPGGKDAERPLQAEETIAYNVSRLNTQFKHIFRGYDFTLVNNLTWTKNMSVVKYLRDYGKYFSMTPLIQRDYIAKRIGENGVGISYAEFSYTILQGLDYLHLYDNYGCTLQLGGSDQWGNCLSGVDLIRKTRGKESHVITLNLVINKATGKKFGKSEEGAVWLDPAKTSIFNMYQFWINSDDEGVADYIKIYTELDKSEIDKTLQEHHQNPAARIAQKKLAYEVVKLVHSEGDAKAAVAASELLFGKEKISLTKSVLNILVENFGVEHVNDIDILEAIVVGSLVESKSIGRQLLASGAISVDGNKVDTSFRLTPGKTHLIKKGKNKFKLITVD